MTLVVTETVTIAPNSGSLPRFTLLGETADGSFIPATAAATDGSQVPSAILLIDAHNSSSEQRVTVQTAGEFCGDELVFDESWAGVSGTAGVITGLTALAPILEARGIYIDARVAPPVTHVPLY